MYGNSLTAGKKQILVLIPAVIPLEVSPMFRDFLQDLRFGLRMLRRSPTFSILVVLCLTLGIGANTTVFSWMEGLMFRPFPLVDSSGSNGGFGLHHDHR